MKKCVLKDQFCSGSVRKDNGIHDNVCMCTYHRMLFLTKKRK